MVDMQRLSYEYLLLLEQKRDDIVLLPKKGDMLHWRGVVRGPPRTPYEGYEFEFEITLSESYPNKNPTGRFITKIYHPNVKFDSGDICLGLLNGLKSERNPSGWDKSNTLADVAKAILVLLAKPYPNDAYNPEAAKLYIENYQEFEKRVNYYCKKYAKPVNRR